MDTSLVDGAVNLAIHRADLHRNLLEQLEPENIFTGKRSADIREMSDGYHVEFEDATRLKTNNLMRGYAMQAIPAGGALLKTAWVSGNLLKPGVVMAVLAWRLSEVTGSIGLPAKKLCRIPNR